ncbi:ATP-binding protein [Pseudoroseomonas cervicalis]|uniref:ATP-binding protein n=1 Tax=Teichococcus cervicalis TaxID=204525 RepID=UPI0022F1988C|nr:ATP-binding protein [Pseudoroseomonas cervicalis]WBV44316.1 ATP-binding protein [Pseudoroseomonas cervicalis]
MSAGVTKLRVKDEDFLVASMIERCPKTMMVRELLQNALEAAMLAPEGERRVEFSALPLEGSRKLAIWNTGPGLTGPELYRMCDIAASIRKETGLDRNFGMGAKVAALPSNQRGLRYRSARKGSVQEVVIGKYDGIYGRLLRPGAEGKPTEVIHVTADAAAEGRETGREWTEVVLLGNAEGQDTVADPYLGQPRSGTRWLLNAITLRYFRFPEGVEVSLLPGTAPPREAGRVVPMQARLAALADYEAVRLPQGIVLHYAYDPEASAPGASDSRKSLAGVVYRDEVYGLLWGGFWRREAPGFGIPFLSRNISVLIELPPDSPVQPDAYREFLRYRSGGQATVKALDFAALVAAHIPPWLQRHLAAAMPDTAYAEEARDTLQELLERLEVRRRRPPQKGAAAHAEAARAAAPEQPELAADGTAAAAAPPVPLRPAPLEQAPQLVLLRDAAEIADRDLAQRAAAYYPQTHQLHINLNYPAIAALAERLRGLAPPEAEPEEVSRAALMVSERAMVLRVARALAHGLAKRDQPGAWKELQLRALLSPESLTLAAEDIDTGWLDSEQAMRTALLMVAAATD